MKQFVITDIHGCLKTSKALLTKIEFEPTDELYLLGDYIDRGPNSKGVIDHIWHLQNAGYTVNCLKGNHEAICYDQATNPDSRYNWLPQGGKECLQSFGVSSAQNIPQLYLNWMNDLPHYFEVGNYILVHAGFKFDMPNPLEEQHSMLWARYWYDKINWQWLGDRIIVHGHTPIELNNILSLQKNVAENQYLNLDNGCVYLNLKKGLGHLVALELGSNELTTQHCLD